MLTNNSPNQFSQQDYDNLIKQNQAITEQTRALQQQVAAQQAFNAAQPQMPEYNNSAWDDQSGLLKRQYQATPQTVSQYYDQRGMNQFRDEALRKGPSAWAGMANQQLQTNMQNAQNTAAAQGAGAMAQARSGMAMRGGLQSGARERLARNGMLDTQARSQDITRQGLMGSQQIGLQDEQNRMQQLSQLPGMEIQALAPRQFDAQNANQAQQFNIQQALQEKRIKDAYGLQGYSERMRAFSAREAARIQADANRGSDGSWLCTEVNKVSPFDSHEVKMLAKFRRYGLKNHKQVVTFYITECAPLIERMNAAAIDWRLLRTFVNAIVSLVEKDKMEAAYTLYREAVIELIQRHWPKCDEAGYKAALAESKAVHEKMKIGG